MIRDKKFIPILILVCSSIFLFNVLTKAFWVIIQIIILKKYNDTTPLAHINAVATLLAIGVTFVIPTLMAKVQTRYLLMAMPMSAMLLVVAFPYLDTTFWGYVLTIGVLIVGGTNQIIGLILINQTLADKFRTTFQGIYNTFYNVSIGVGPLLVAAFGAENKFTLYGFLAIGLLMLSTAFFFDRVEWSFQDPPAPEKPSKFQKWMSGIDVIKSNSILLLLVTITCLNMSMVSHLLVFWGDSYALDLQTSKALPAVFALGGCLALYSHWVYGG